MSELLVPGQIFAGRYRIEKFLAQGGFGAVYVAEQTETELRVALKVLWPHVLHSEDAVEKFKLEARVAGRVGSDHIVKVFDAGFDEASRMPFLVMELLKGEELEKTVEQQGPVRPDLLIMYLRQVASALDKAHGYVDRDGQPRPIVHRDLKPENLFLTYRETGEPIVKILDFGIAKVLSDSTKVSQEVKGTPLYMAYEQATAGRILPQTDIWALGLIAFYLLTGRSYWKAANLPEASLTQLFGEVLSLPLDPPSQRATEIAAPVVPSMGFDAWFARCVNRDQAARFATAGECVAALTTVFGEPETRLSPGAFGAEVFAATARASVPLPSPAMQKSAPHVTAGAAPTVRSSDDGIRPGRLGNTTGAASALSQTASPTQGPARTAASGAIATVAIGIVVAGIVFVSRGHGGDPKPADGVPSSTPAAPTVLATTNVPTTKSVAPASTATAPPPVTSTNPASAPSASEARASTKPPQAVHPSTHHHAVVKPSGPTTPAATSTRSSAYDER